MKQGQDLQSRMTLKFFELILSKEEEEKEKEKIMALIRRYEKSRDKREIGSLNAVQGKMYILLHDGFTSYKEAFLELIKQDKYKVVADTFSFDINDYLLSIQSNININKDQLNIQGLVAKYTVNMLKLKKTYDSWPKDLLSDWNNKAKDKLKKAEQKRLSKSKPDDQKPYRESESEDESPEQKPKPAVQVYKPEKEREPERRFVVDKPRRLEPRLESASKAQMLRENRNKMMQRYLESRRDIHIDRAKIKEVSQFLASRLDNFMKKTMQKIIDVASLKNKKSPKLGNQVGYFAAGTERITPQSSFYYSANSKIYMLQYKHKLEIYTTLRSKEIKKEDELRNALQANTNENEKKVDKKIENYMLKPRPKEVEPVEIFKEDRSLNKAGNMLLISAEHALYYLENHRYLRNSLLLFNAYHY